MTGYILAWEGNIQIHVASRMGDSMKTALALTWTLCAMSAQLALAAPFQNGSFESNALASPGRVAISNLTTWTSSGGFLLLERGVNGDSFLAAAAGVQFVSFGHSGTSNGTLVQSFDTTIGQIYTVNYSVTSSYFNGVSSTNQIMRVTAFDSTNAPLNTVDTIVPVNPNNTWGTGVALVFTATTTTSKIEFRDVVPVVNAGNSFANIAIDNVLVSVPEPASLAMGLLMLLPMFRSRRHMS
jgi:hypothetical protein